MSDDLSWIGFDPVGPPPRRIELWAPSPSDSPMWEWLQDADTLTENKSYGLNGAV